MTRIPPSTKREAMDKLGNIFISHAKHTKPNKTISEYYQWCVKFRSPQTFFQTKRIFKKML